MTKKNQKGFLEWLVSWGTLTALFIIPLIYFSSRLGGGVTSKQFFFIGAVDLLVIAWTWLLVTDSRYRFSTKSLYVLAPLTLFFGSAALSTFFGADVATSLYSTVARGVGFIFLVHTYLFALILTSVTQVQGMEFFKKSIKTLFISSVIVAISTFFTKEAIDIGSEWLNDTSGGGLLGNSSLAGTFLVFGIFTAIANYFWSEKRNAKIATVVGFIVIALSPIFFNVKGFLVTKTAWAELGSNALVLIGQARAATLAVVIGLVIAALVYGIVTSRKTWMKVTASGLLAVVVLGLLVVSVKVATPGSSIQNAFINNVGANRIIFWQEGVQGIKERPLIGWGLENYRMVHAKYLDPALLGSDYGFEVWSDKPHNIFIEVLVGQGIIGLVTYIAVLGSVIGYTVVLVRREVLDAKTGSLLIGMMSAYVIQNQLVFDSITSTVVFWSIAGTLGGMMLFSKGGNAANNSVNNRKGDLTATQYTIGGGVSILALIAWVMLAIIPAQKMVEAKKVFDGPIVTRVTQYDKLFSGFGARYLMTDLGVLSYGLAEAYSNERAGIAAEPEHLAIALKEVETFQTVVDENAYYTHNDYRVRLAQAMFNEVELSMRGSYSESEVNQMVDRIEKVIVLSPTNPLGYLVYGRILVFADRIDEGRAMIKKAITLNPKIKQAHDLLNAFEGFYGTQAQKRDALTNAQAAIPGYEYTPR